MRVKFEKLSQNPAKIYLFILVLFFDIHLNISAQTADVSTANSIKPQKSVDFNDIPPAFGCGFPEGGYSSKLSVYQGESINFYVSTKADTFSLKIYRYGKTKEFITEIPGLEGGLQEVKESDQAYINGCKWRASLKDFKIPENWKAGAYLAEFPAQSDTINPILFFVKEKDPSRRSKVIVACATNTYQAYNMFGGKSSYPAYSSGGNTGINYSVKLSFNRPFNRNDHNKINRASFYSFDSKLIKWLEEYGYGNNIDVVGDCDLDSDPEYLNSHKVLFIGGHSEYWSRGMRENVENFISNGGHFMCLSGNTCWWQIRYEDNYRTFVCYKHLTDPISDPKLTTNEWMNTARENTFVGTSYQNGGQANYGSNPGCLNNSLGYGGYIVYNSQHWAFKNSHLNDGDTLGWRGDSSIVGYETDAALFKFQNGIPVPTGTDQTPLNFRILGISAVNSLSKNEPKEWATMGIFKYPKPGSGFVFNAATIRWVWGLYSKNSKVSAVTKNILDHFLQDKFPPELTAWTPYIIKNDSLFKKPVAFNSCSRELPFGKNMLFKVDARDYKNERINFTWSVNDTVLPYVKGNSFIYQSVKHPFGMNKITVFAYNSKDTSSISWEIKSIEGILFINSIPDTIINKGQSYEYQLNHYCKFNDLVKYTINYMPLWAKFDTEKSIISGIPDSRRDSIKISVEDQHGNIDTQNFILYSSETTSVNSENKSPERFSLSQNYPNPFNPSTRINYSIPEGANISLKIYDILGKEIATLVNEYKSPGNYSVEFNASNLPSGIYIYKMEAGKFTDSKKLSVIK